MDSAPGDAGEHAVYHPGGDGSLTATVVEAVAAVTGEEPTAMEPLGSVVDPEALEGLVASLRRSSEGGRVAFTFAGCRVTVTADGAVRVSRPPAGHPPVTTGEAFQAALARLLREAETNGVAVDGGWACRDGSLPTWGIEIYEVEE